MKSARSTTSVIAIAQSKLSIHGCSTAATGYLSGAVLLCLAVASCLAAATPQITRAGDVVALHNEEVRFEFDLSKGTYRILSDGGRHPVISDAMMKINQWSSDDAAFKRLHEARAGDGPFGEELSLDLRCTAENRPELLFSIARQSHRPVVGFLRSQTMR